LACHCLRGGIHQAGLYHEIGTFTRQPDPNLGSQTIIRCAVTQDNGNLIGLLFSFGEMLAALPCLLAGAGAIAILYLFFAVLGRWADR